jgi:hypothetical protein
MLEQSVDRLSNLIEQLIKQLEAGRQGAAPAAAAEVPKAAKPAKVEKPKALEPVAASEPAGPAPEPARPTPQAIDYEAVKAATSTLAKAKGRDAVLAVLGSFEVDNAVKLPLDMYARYVAACEQALV